MACGQLLLVGVLAAGLRCPLDPKGFVTSGGCAGESAPTCPSAFGTELPAACTYGNALLDGGVPASPMPALDASLGGGLPAFVPPTAGSVDCLTHRHANIPQACRSHPHAQERAHLCPAKKGTQMQGRSVCPSPTRASHPIITTQPENEENAHGSTQIYNAFGKKYKSLVRSSPLLCLEQPLREATYSSAHGTKGMSSVVQQWEVNYSRN